MDFRRVLTASMSVAVLAVGCSKSEKSTIPMVTAPSTATATTTTTQARPAVDPS